MQPVFVQQSGLLTDKWLINGLGSCSKRGQYAERVTVNENEFGLGELVGKHLDFRRSQDALEQEMTIVGWRAFPKQKLNNLSKFTKSSSVVVLP